ncbi:hypothetical protein ACFXAZ_04565 [Streptomyces sp. NPDC059477]|uniref:hypothetical protein n=1 Tax=Streptomyces sp. NPDC059477 TaxID=3346847 RepID=UPI0036B9F9BA
MAAQHLSVGQWWIVAVATSALFVVAFHFAVRNRRATAYALIAPVLGALSVVAHSRARGQTGTEALVIFAACTFSMTLVLIVIRYETLKSEQKARAGEKYVLPKWKANVYGLLTVAFACVIAFLLL